MPEWAKNALIGIGVLIVVVYIAIPIAANGLCATIGVGCSISNNLWADATRPSGGRAAIAGPHYIPGAPRNPAECRARGGQDTGRGCRGYH